MVPKGWQIRKLDDVLEKVIDPVQVNPESIYEEIGIRSHGRGIFHKAPIPGKALGDKRVFWVQPGCFVVNIVFAWEQAVARTTEKEIGKIASHRFPMYHPKNGRADVDYLLYFFKTPRGKYLLELASPGGAGRNKTLGQKEFGNLEFLMPSAAEQKKIVRIFSTWDNAIEVVGKLIENSKAQKKSLMQQLLTGRLRFPGFASPWKEVKLSDIADVLVSNVDKKISTENEHPVKLCNYTDVYYNEYLSRSMDFMMGSATPQEIDKFKLLRGDVLITKDSETPEDIAVPAYVTEDLTGVICGYHLAIIRPKKGLADGLFLSKLFSISTVRHQFFTLANGVTRYGLGSGSIAKAKLRIPEIEEQKVIGKALQAINLEIINKTKQLSCLKEQKKALMQQLLTGKRRVKVDKS